jgi:Tfp pilus assembly protein PilX
VVAARGVAIATILVALVLLGLLGLAASSFSPATIKQQACESKQLPASECE